MNRRAFLIAASAAGRILGANDRIRVGGIGSGNRGKYLIEQFKEIGAEIPKVCDVYQPNLEAGLKAASTGAKGVSDYRRLLDDPTIDAVIVATPDHWHARMTIDAVQAGKDVYVEKPLAHTIPDGYAIIEAVRRTKRVVQVGMQRRSSELFQDAKSLLDRKQAGTIRLVTSEWLNNQTFRRLSLTGDLDWKQWLGSAPDRPVDPARFFNWMWFSDYSGGLLIQQGAHIVDCIQWFMNSGAPSAVTCTGNRPAIAGAEVTDTAVMACEYGGDYLATFTLGYQAMRYATYNDQVQRFHGNRARLDVGREYYQLFPESNAIEMKPSVESRKPGSFAFAAPSHIRNFLECVRSRKDPNAPVEVGQDTNIALGLAMASLRDGSGMKWDALRKVITRAR